MRIFLFSFHHRYCCCHFYSNFFEFSPSCTFALLPVVFRSRFLLLLSTIVFKCKGVIIKTNNKIAHVCSDIGVLRFTHILFVQYAILARYGDHQTTKIRLMYACTRCKKSKLTSKIATIRWRIWLVSCRPFFDATKFHLAVDTNSYLWICFFMPKYFDCHFHIGASNVLPQTGGVIWWIERSVGALQLDNSRFLCWLKFFIKQLILKVQQQNKSRQWTKKSK